MKNKEFICRLESSIRAWIELVETDDLIFKMSQNAFDLVSLDATSLAYDLMRMINIEFTESQKNKAKDILDSFQLLENGFFVEKDYKNRLNDNDINRVTEMHANYITFQVVGAYKAIDRFPNKKISFYDQFIDGKGIKHYLSNNCPWDRSPWGAGGMVDNLGTILDCNIRMGYLEYQTVLDEVFEWLEENQSSEHGLWGDLGIQGINGLINGGYHLMRGTYFLQNKLFSFHENIIDVILKDTEENDIFSSLEANGCQDLDHFYLLEKCVNIDSNYRKDEIQEVVQKRLNKIENIVYCEDGGFSFEARNAAKNHNYYDVSPGIKESDMQGTVFYLQTIISMLNIIGIKHEFRYSRTHG
jgi:acyl carrier protein